MRSRCKDCSDFRPQAFPYGHWRPPECSCATSYRSQHKKKKEGENAVTRDYYQLTHEIANHRAVMEQGEAVRDQFEPELVHSVFPCSATPPDKY